MKFQLVKGFIGSKQASTIETKTASPEKGPIRARPHVTVGTYLVFFKGITLHLVKSCVPQTTRKIYLSGINALIATISCVSEI